MKTTAISCLPRPPNIMRAQCPEAREENYLSDYLWKLNNMLFMTFSWIYMDLVDYRAEGYVYVSDTQNSRIVLLDLYLDWVNSFTVTASYALTGDSTHLYAGWATTIDKYLRSAPFTLIDTGTTVSSGDMDSDDDYLYLEETRNGEKRILIYAKSDYSLIDEFDTGFSLDVAGIAVDDTYIYCYSEDSILKKFKKSDHSEVASIDVHDVDGIYCGFGMDDDTDYLYFPAGQAAAYELIAVYNKSDLSQNKTITVAATTYARDVAVYGDYVYQTDFSGHVVRKVQISTGSVVATFGVDGTSGSDTSHLKYPDGITVI